MSMIPAMYQPIFNNVPMPRMISEALLELGTIETPGRGNNPHIMAWRDELEKHGVKGVQGYSADSVPWCGLFMAVIAVRAGKTPPDNPLWALNWAKFGTEGHQPNLGDVCVFIRPGGGHVAMYVAEDTSTYHIVGGNQGDKVSITRIDKHRLYAVRRPLVHYAYSPWAKPYIIAPNGSISTNEA